MVDRLGVEPNLPAGLTTADWQATPEPVRALVLSLLPVADQHGLEALIALGSQAAYSEQYQQAIAYYRQALMLAQHLDDFVSQTDMATQLGFAHLALAATNYMHLADQLEQTGDYRQSLLYYRNAFTIWEFLGIQKWQCQILNGMGSLCLTLAEYDQALLYSQMVLDIVRLAQSHEEEEFALTNLGNAYLFLGRITDAISQFKHALLLANGRTSHGIKALIGLGAACNQNGQLQEALTYLQKAQAIALDLDDHLEAGLCFINLANVYMYLGDYAEACACSEQAKTYTENVKQKRVYRLALIALGNALTLAGDEHDDARQQSADWEKAIEHFNLAEQVIEHGEIQQDRHSQLMVRLNRATVLIRQEHPEDALAVLDSSALPLAHEIGDLRGIAYCYLNIANAQVMLGEHQEQASGESGRASFELAQVNYWQALPRLKAAQDDEGRRAIYGRLGDLYFRWLKNDRKARRSYALARELWNRTRGQLNEEHRISFFARGEDPFKGSVLLYLKMRQTAQALEIAEQAKSRAFLERLASSLHQLEAPELHGAPLKFEGIQACLRADSSLAQQSS